MPSRPPLHSPTRNPKRSVARFIYGISCLKTGLEKFSELDFRRAKSVLSERQGGLKSFSELIADVRKNVNRALAVLRPEGIEEKDLTDPPKKRRSKQTPESIVQTLLGGITAFQNGIDVLFEEPRHNILNLLKIQKTPPEILKSRLLSIWEMLKQLDREVKKITATH